MSLDGQNIWRVKHLECKMSSNCGCLAKTYSIQVAWIKFFDRGLHDECFALEAFHFQHEYFDNSPLQPHKLILDYMSYIAHNINIPLRLSMNGAVNKLICLRLLIWHNTLSILFTWDESTLDSEANDSFGESSVLGWKVLFFEQWLKEYSCHPSTFRKTHHTHWHIMEWHCTW